MSSTPDYDRYGLRARAQAADESWLARTREGVRAIVVLLGVTFRADPRNAVGATLLEIFGGVAFAITALWLKVLADGVVADNHRTVVAAAIGMAAFQGVNWLGQAFGTRMRITLMERVGFAFDARIAELTSRLPGLEHNERPEYQDRLILLREAQGLLGGGANALVNFVNATLRGLAAVVLLAVVHPLLLLLPAFAVPRLVTQAVSQRWMRRADDESAPHRRRALHLYGLVLHEPPSRELRIFGLRDEIHRRLAAAWNAGTAPLIRAQTRTAIFNGGATAVSALGYVAAVVLVVRLAANRDATAGDVLLTISLAGQVSSHVAALVGNISVMQRMLRETRRLVWLVDYSADQWDQHQGAAAPPTSITTGITLEHVSFRYPGTDRWVLRDINLHLPPGPVVALVGENGAGKTTLVKLLCRFYDPTEGRILVDGVDLKDIDVAQWRSRLAAGFQDFSRLELAAGQAVGVGDLPRIDDDQAVRNALARAGAEDFDTSLPAGMATQLGARWDGGIDLSGGQWQKIALGRTLMRDEPLLLILDEPTASLDAPTEHELFERLAAASRHHETNRTTVIVSHRFSTVRMADHIVVIDAATVAEQGSHHELMAANGLYAELYRIQASAFA